MNWTRVALCFLAIQSGLVAQTVQVVGIQNEAGHGGLSPGSRASIYWWPYDLRLEPGAVTVQVGGRPAAVLDIGEHRVLVQLPVELSPGLTTVVMIVRGAASAPANIQLEPYAPVLLRLSREPPLGDVLHSCQPGAVVAPGEIVIAIATGLGATNPVVPTGARAPASPPAATLVKPKISVLWQEAEVMESVLIPGEIGLYRIRFRVPPGDGWHPMALHIAGYDSFPLILPVGSGLISVSTATWRTGPTAPESLMVASACANSLATAGPPGFVGDPRNPPAMLGGTTVRVKDSSGMERPAQIYYADRFQVNYIVPAGTAHGSATVTVTSGDGTTSSGRLEIQPVAPGMFTMWAESEGFDDDGVVPAGHVVRLRDGVRTVESLFEKDSAGRIVRVPVDLSRDTDETYLVLYGTGIRFRSSLANVIVAMAGSTLPVDYAGPQDEFPGLDQISVRLRSRLAAGLHCLRVAVDARQTSVGCVAVK